MASSDRPGSEERGTETPPREREQRYERILTEISDVVTVLAEDGTVRYESPSIERVFGYRPEELEGRPVFEFIHPDDLDEVSAAFHRAVANPDRDSPTVQYRHSHANGSWRLAESTAVVPEDEGLGVVVVTRDITRRKQFEGALERAEEKFEAVFDVSPVALQIVDAESGEHLDVNRTFEEVFGWDAGDLLDGSVEGDRLWEDAEVRERIQGRLRDGETVRNREVLLRRRDGTSFDGLYSASLLERGADRLLVEAVQDISHLKAVERELEYRSLHDPLTGLANRTLLSDRIEQGVARARRRGGTIGVLMLDVDDFKGVNDRLGHTAGDRVLTEVSRRLRDVFRAEDTVARWGGDEFAVVLPEVGDPDATPEIGERVAASLRRPIRAGGDSVDVSVTIGMVLHGDGDDGRLVGTGDPDRLVRYASQALHRAKEEAPGGFELFDRAGDTGATARIRREREFRDDLERDRILVHYQPIVRLDDGALEGVEALARWNHPERGLLGPDEFVPLAEALGLTEELEGAVLRRGCREVAAWTETAAQSSALPVGFNVSGRHLGDAGRVDGLVRRVEEAGLRPDRLTLEISDAGPSPSPKRIGEARERGFRVYADGFGTGPASLARLRDLELDGVKIDPTLVRRVDRDAANAAVVEAILVAADRLGMTAVAVGVETEEQRRELLRLGCELGQGGLFDRPGGLEEVA